jgi:sedoheptulose-bisphosphatase
MGAAQISLMAERLVGVGKLIDPSRLEHVYVSPRKRAVRTFELLLPGAVDMEKVTKTEDIAEWNYGDYEGLKVEEIRNLRKERGLDKEWDIWSDGCEGGE